MQGRTTHFSWFVPAVMASAAIVTVAAASISAAVPAVAAVAAVDTEAPAPFDLVADAGDYQTGFAIASPWTSVSASWYLTTDDVSSQLDISYEMAIDGVVQRTVQAQDTALGTYTKRLDVPDGSHVLTITAIDEAGNRQPANQQLSVVVDKFDPTFMPGASLDMRRAHVTPEAVPMRFTWKARDVGTGLSSFRVGYGSTCCFETGPKATSANFDIPTYSDRTFRVIASDGVGRTDHVSRKAWIRPLAAKQLDYRGGWNAQRVSGSFSTKEHTSNDRGDRAIFDVRGRAFAWVATLGPKRGVADVYVDGRLVDSVNLRADSLRPSEIVYVRQVSVGHQHRVVIVNRSPRDRATIGVDAILIQSAPQIP